MKIKAYTDGACSGNPGKGGWGGVICLPDKLLKMKGFDPDTTNNRMELFAVCSTITKVLELIYQEVIDVDNLEIISDSAYVINSINQNWLGFWKNNGYINSKGENVKNKDLWVYFDGLLAECEYIGLKLEFTKVKGHAGDPMNELADRLAVSAYEELSYGGR